MHIKAAEATRVEVTGLGLGDLPEPYFAEDGSDAWYDITTSLNETGFGLSGNIVLYGDFSGTDAGDSLVEFLFRPLDDLNDRKSGKLTVTVEKVDGGEVAGLPVSVGGDLSATLHTDQSGVVKLTGVSAGTYTVNASAPGYTSDGPDEVVLDSDSDEGSVTITLTPVPPPPPPPGPGAIHGTVRDGGTGSPLPGALVKLHDGTGAVAGMAVAMLEGEFAFEGIEPGSYSVKATLDGYDPAVEHAVVANDATTVVNAVLAGVVTIVEPSIPPAEPPELPKTGAGIFGFVALGLAAATVGYGLRRR